METLTQPLQSEQQMQPATLDLGTRDTLAKLDFEGLDPRYSDVVYHVTYPDSKSGIDNPIGSIEQEGLRYSDTSTYEDFGTWAQNTERLIERKPADIPVDLHHTVFGQLQGDKLGYKSDTGTLLRTSMDKAEMMEIAVDPDETYVADGKAREDILGGHIPSVFSGNWEQRPMYPSQEAQIDDYWSSIMPLSTFRELYQPAVPEYEGDDSVAWTLKNPEDATKLGLTPKMYAPETFIPLEPGKDTIETERLKHTASSLAGRDPVELAKAQEASDAAAEAEQQQEIERQQSIERVVQANQERQQRDQERKAQQAEKERQQNEKIERYGGRLGLQLAELYIDYNDATDRVGSAQTDEQRKQAEINQEQTLGQSQVLLDPQRLTRKHIENDALRDANAAGHDLHFGGEHYPAAQ